MSTKTKSRVGKEISHVEEKAIIGYFGSVGQPKMADLAGFLLDSGFRVREALGLGVKSKASNGGALISGFNLDNGLITSYANITLTSRTIPMTPRVREILTRGGNTPFESLSDHSVYHRWHDMQKALNLDDCILHNCRFTCGRRLFRCGADIQMVKDWLGQSDIRITMRCFVQPELKTI